MTRCRAVAHLALWTTAITFSLIGCSPPETGPGGSGGQTTPGSGGVGTGGAPSTSGGAPGSGGAAPGSGGASSGGSSSGGAGTGGASTGGASSGGMTGSAGAGSGGRGGSAAGSGGRGGASAGSGGAAGGGTPAAGGATGVSRSAGCGTTPTIPSSMYNNGMPIPIMVGTLQRRYILSVPTGYDNMKPYKVVIAWHQLDGNDRQMYSQNYYWLKDIADAASNVIFVAPNGTKNNAPCTGTGTGGEMGCGWPDQGGAQIALADAVIAEVEKNFCIDKNRIFANGWSYGGSMSYRTACSRPQGGAGTWGVRGVAVYNGAANLSSGGCTPSKQVAFYASHGTNDTILGYDGGVSMATTYARLNGCTAMTPTRASGNKVCTNYMGCMAGWPVEFCSFVGGHTPDPPRENNQRWQPAEVWKFFNQF